MLSISRETGGNPGMKTDAEVKKLFEEFAKFGKIEQASRRANMSRNTGARYIRTGKLPSEMKQPRDWLTRGDLFKEDWTRAEEMLSNAPELEAKALFEFLMEQNPGQYVEGQLRTFQRRVRDWRATNGPDKEVFFPQEHRPGEAMQLDFTNANKLGVTLQGEPFPHLLGHLVLPYSNWEHASACKSESMLAIRQELQRGLKKLQHVPEYLQTDQTTAATHRPEMGQTKKEATSAKRPFNAEYEELVKHFGIKPRTIGVGKCEQNGDVESLHRAMKSRLNQHLLLRGSRDFESREAYESWIEEILDRANANRQEKIHEELKQMRPLRVRLLPEYREETVPVLTWSTINVMRNIYSLPSRLIGEKVKVRVYEARVEVYYKGVHQLTAERLMGRGNAKIEYRHIISSLVRKPGAFARYRYREQMFPSLVYRRAYDSLSERMTTYKADLEYLRVLKLAAETMESEVEVALELLLEEKLRFDSNEVKELVRMEKPQVPEMKPLTIRLEEYDGLLLDWLEEVA